MPMYEFQCQQCQLEFRKSLPFGSKEIPVCPKCRGKTKKIIRPPAIMFRGGGFYKTDSQSAAPASAKPADKPAETTKASEAPTSPASSTTPAPAPKKDSA